MSETLEYIWSGGYGWVEDLRRDLPSPTMGDLPSPTMGDSPSPTMGSGELVTPWTPQAGPSTQAMAPVVEPSKHARRSFQEEFAEMQTIKKYMQVRRKTVSIVKYPAPALKLDEQDVAGMIEGMACVDCGKVASPRRRFCCPRGHQFCWECGRKHFVLNNTGVGTGVCLKKAEAGDTAKPIRAVGYGSIHPEAELGDDEIEEWIKNKKTGSTECRLFLRKGNADPLYMALFNNSVWDCPLKIAGCDESVLGMDSQDHIWDCLVYHGFV